jgi:hypothetical protein
MKRLTKVESYFLLRKILQYYKFIDSKASIAVRNYLRKHGIF